jgi:hypothetical protein
MPTAILFVSVALGMIALTAVPSAADHNTYFSTPQGAPSARAAMSKGFAPSALVAPSPEVAPPAQDVPSAQTAPSAPERSSLEVDLKLGMNGFRIGGRLFSKDGYTGGAWLNGETRPDGFTVDGRVEREGGKSWNFKLNADIDEALRKAMRWWGGTKTDL